MLREAARAEGPIAAGTLNLRSAHDSGNILMGSWEPQVAVDDGFLTLSS